MMKTLVMLLLLVSAPAMATVNWTCQYERRLEDVVGGIMNFSLSETHLKHGGNRRGHGYMMELKKNTLIFDAWKGKEQQQARLVMEKQPNGTLSPAKPVLKVKFSDGSSAQVSCH